MRIFWQNLTDIQNSHFVKFDDGGQRGRIVADGGGENCCNGFKVLDLLAHVRQASHHKNGIKTVILNTDWLKAPQKEPRTVPVSLHRMDAPDQGAGTGPGKLRRMTSAGKLAVVTAARHPRPG